MMSSSAVLVWTLLLLISSVCNVECSTRPNFYAATCPGAEATIAGIVSGAVKQDRRVGAGMIRLLFHDCFVEGCDASVLIDSPFNNAEKDAIPNQNLHSLQLIDQAKAVLEGICPRAVSCADIIATAAAVSLNVLGGPFVDLQGGRFDGLVSRISEANRNLPAPFFNLGQLQNIFGSKGLSTEDMVVLSGAHTVGKAHCPAFSPRLRNFSPISNVDPTLDPRLAIILQKQCPVKFSPNTLVSMDPSDTIFDNTYYQDVNANRGLFGSDAALHGSSFTQGLVNELAGNNGDFLGKFAGSFFKMSQIGLKTSRNGNIRRNCRSFT